MTETESYKDLAEYIEENLEGSVISHAVEYGELALTVCREDVVKVLQFLKDDAECHFHMLLSVCGVDYPDRVTKGQGRFEVVYTLLSMTQNNRIRVKVPLNEGEMVPTATRLFSSAGWFERETWDMYGIYFEGHTDLRRILTDYGFDGHPLRKDFPLTGYVELRYDEEQRRVVYEPVKLMQDFRAFDYLSPWEGMTNVQLPGDEKGAVPEHGWKPTTADIPNSEKKSA